jgi:4-amino-4-deoxy-L-arabinose transferase-like glycosyltransferase
MHAEIAREVLLTGDWTTLHLNGVRYFDKPPLLYWLTALSLTAWGPTEWAARLGPALGALAALGGTALLGARLLSPRAGVVAGLALLTSAGFFAYGRYLRPETLFVAAIQWGFALLLLGSGKSRRLAALGGCAALGIAALVKDPLGALGPLAAVSLALAVAGRFRPVSTWLPWGGVALLLALGGAWYLVVEFKNPGFLWYTVVDNHFLNIARARYFPDEDVPLSGVEFLGVAGLGAFPWVLPAALTVAGLIRRRGWREPGEAPWVALAVWAVGVYTLFALAPFKLPHYGLPAYPALALLAARWWDEGRAVRPVLALHLVAFVAIAVGSGWVYGGDGQGFMAWVFGATDVYTRKELALGQAAPFPLWDDLRGLIGGTALAFGAGSVGLLVAIVRGARGAGLGIILVTLLVWLPLVGSAVSLVAASRSVRPIAAEVSRRAGPEDLLVHEGPIENSGALEFYTGRRPAILDGRVSVLGFGATFPEAGGTFWERPRLAEAWRSPRRVFLLTTRAPAKSVVADLLASEVHQVAAGGGRWLYSNRAE